MTLTPRAVLVHRTTELDELVARHGTRQQAAFFLRSRDRSLDEVRERHAALTAALTRVSAGIPVDWRRVEVERGDLDRFVFGPEDVVVAVGQDGLVANLAKYLSGQPVVGVDPEPGRNAGVLVRHAPDAVAGLLSRAEEAGSQLSVERRTMVEARTDEGQTLTALNELYIGHRSHQSARYRIAAPPGRSERQSSSGILVGTGTGATGWLQSVWLGRGSPLALPEPTGADLCWFVREAWPSPATGATCTDGLLELGDELAVTAETDLVVFGDGIESDSVNLAWGQQVTVTASAHRLHLVT